MRYEVSGMGFRFKVLELKLGELDMIYNVLSMSLVLDLCSLFKLQSLE